MKYLLITLLFPTVLSARTIKIAIIDSGLDDVQRVGLNICANGLVDFTNSSMHSDFNGHGNNIAHIIGDKVTGDYCMYVFKAFSEASGDDPNVSFANDAITKAIDLKVDVINYSAGGSETSEREASLVSKALKAGIRFVAAAGNDKHDLDKKCDFFPGCIPGVTMIGNIKNSVSNYGKIIKEWRNGNHINAGGVTLTGTSQATAIYSHELLIKLIQEQK